jgi:hypothetical protein
VFSNQKISKLQGKRNIAPEGSFREQFPMFVMFAPFAIFFIIFTIIPILSSIFFSFTSYDMISSPNFVALDNYRRLITNDPTFIITVKNTFIFAVVSGPIGFLLAFLLFGGGTAFIGFFCFLGSSRSITSTTVAVILIISIIVGIIGGGIMSSSLEADREAYREGHSISKYVCPECGSQETSCYTYWTNDGLCAKHKDLADYGLFSCDYCNHSWKVPVTK